MINDSLERARRLLCQLQDTIRDALIAKRAQNAKHFARIAGVTAADTIYHVDRLSEDAIMDWFKEHWPRTWPVELIMEGIADGVAVTFPSGTPVKQTQFKCILDPIDGTRCLMYDKRPAWILTALAPQRGSKNHLGDIAVAAMTELPTSKQGRADQFSAIRGRGVVAQTMDLLHQTRRRFTPRPSQARNFEHGFASLVKFFPAGKTITAQIEEDLWRELHGDRPGAGQLVFDDQYLATGGQLYELLVGHDRMIGDLRPLVFQKLGLSSALACHPYDICTALIFQEAGGLVESPEGRPLRIPLDTTTPVAWVGYANATLARSVRPILGRLLKKYLT